MALATLHIAAIPILAGLVAGTGAVATYVSAGEPAKPVQTAAVSTEAPVVTKSCDAQTWPYIEQRCLAGNTNAAKPVRLVSAPTNESVQQTNTTPAPSVSAAPAPDAGKLVSRDTVLRAPNYTNSIPAVPDNLASGERVTRKQMRREARKQRNERRFSAQSYQVPAEFDRRSARPIVVVRPLRLDTFR